MSKRYLFINVFNCMVIRTFIDKCTTIVKESEDNFGLNPIAMLNYGKMVSRFLIYFDEKKINSDIFHLNGVKHILKMVNCASVDDRTFKFFVPSADANGIKKRATSFNILAIKVPNRWDEGVGFDDSSDIWLRGDSAVSLEGCNWYQAQNGLDWDVYGIYDNKTISAEYDKFSKGEDSIIVARQHFDHGNENLELDLTDYVNDLINGKTKNYGLMLCFTPELEDRLVDITQYVGFFTNNTNTFFEPYLESRTDECVLDDRNRCYIGKLNRLYLYTNIGGERISLDKMPVCTIEGKTYDVKQQTKGVYYCEVMFTDKSLADTILYDNWSNLSYDGVEIDDVEQEFVVLSNREYFNMSNSFVNDTNYSATIIGINDREKIIPNDIRMVKIEFKRKYDTKNTFVLDNIKYRLYVMNGNKELDVISWDTVNRAYDANYFMLDTNTLIPNDYHIDVKMETNGQVKVFKDKVKFTIMNNCTNIKK